MFLLYPLQGKALMGNDAYMLWLPPAELQACHGPSHSLLIRPCTHMQGGLLVDGFAVLLSGAAGTAPSVSYCMNGFIAISRVASRGSGAFRPSC